MLLSVGLHADSCLINLFVSKRYILAALMHNQKLMNDLYSIKKKHSDVYLFYLRCLKNMHLLVKPVLRNIRFFFFSIFQILKCLYELKTIIKSSGDYMDFVIIGLWSLYISLMLSVSHCIQVLCVCTFLSLSFFILLISLSSKKWWFDAYALTIE